MSYSGWKQLINLTIVYSIDKVIKINENVYPVAYVTDGSKNSIDAAIRWATNYTNKEPEIIKTTNEDFTLSLASAASGSIQGGKLSFWMCVMSKKGIKSFAVGINSDLLFKLMLNSDFIKGKCNTKVIFARYKGQLGVLHKNMDEYKFMLNDEKTKHNVSIKKSSKWKVGYEYKTLTKSSIMLGNFRKIMDIKASSITTPSHVMHLNLNSKILPIIYDHCDTFEKVIEWYFLNYYGPNFITKCPERQEGEKKFNESDIPIFINTLINTISNLNNYSTLCIPGLIATAFSVYDLNKDATLTILNTIKNHIIDDINTINSGNRATHFNNGHNYGDYVSVMDRTTRFEIKDEKTTTVFTDYTNLVDYFILLAEKGL